VKHSGPALVIAEVDECVVARIQVLDRLAIFDAEHR